MDYNYHTHTTRCSHAEGREEAYIERAIAGGIKYMGFSDHAPFVFPDGYESPFRVPMALGDDYICKLRLLRERYKDRIDLKIGFEMEYYPKYFDSMLQTVRDFGAEYLILGQHFLGNEHPCGLHTQRVTGKTEDIQEYVSTVIAAMETGVFSYVAHPDIIKFDGDISVYRQEMRKICAASRQHNIPLEINFLGIRQGRNYPDPVFWGMVGQEQCPVTFGFDAHDTMAAYDSESLVKAEKMVEQFGLNYIGRPVLTILDK